MEELTFKDDKVLINAYFYTFWMPIDEFNKFIPQKTKTKTKTNFLFN